VIHTPLKDYATRLYCLACRRSVLCPVCHSTVSLQKENKLTCWKCGRQFAYHYRCKHCGGELLGFGSTGAEYTEERIKAAIPDTSVKIISGDVVRNEGIDRLTGLFDDPRTIVVGTQILSKFYDLKADRLVLIGWEEFLRITGYRAREHMYQTYGNLIDALRPSAVDLLVVDRAREPAEVLGMDREVFYREELEQRRMAEFPPYVRLFLFRIDAPDNASAEGIAKRVRGVIEKHGLRESVVGETAAIGGSGRITILIKGEESLLDPVIDEVYRVRHLRVEVDPLWV
jgi:primosomal protein N' (replication factor Y) (superfamily II helicase)